MVRPQVRKLANPHKRRVVRARKRNATVKRRRKMSPKQIRIFGTKAQKAALKRSRTIKKVRRPVKVSRKRARKNPSLLITLGQAMNPHKKKGRTSMAKTKRRTRRVASKRRRVSMNRRRVHRRRRTNPVARKVRRRRARRSNPKVVVRYRARKNRARRTRHISRRNPSLFGSSITSRAGLEIVGGALAGVVAAKFIPTLIPTSILGSLGGSNIGKVLITGVSAVAAGWAAGKFIGRGFGDSVLLGGLMQTASVALNGFLPSVYSNLGIGLGDLTPGSYVVPQNPITAGMMRPALPPAGNPAGGQARVQMNGLARAFGSAY